MNPLRAAPLLLALAGCTTGLHSGRWIGPVTPAAPGPQCQASRGMLQRSGDTTAVTFAPDEGAWLLRGAIAQDGAIDAERITTGANKQAYETRFVGKLAGNTITGTYKTPKCTFDVKLTER